MHVIFSEKKILTYYNTNSKIIDLNSNIKKHITWRYRLIDHFRLNSFFCKPTFIIYYYYNIQF